MMMGLLDELKHRRAERPNPSLGDWRELVRAVGKGEHVPADKADAILATVGKTPEELAAAVEHYKSRVRSSAMIQGVAALDRQIKTLTDQLESAAAARNAAVAAAERDYAAMADDLTRELHRTEAERMAAKQAADDLLCRCPYVDLVSIFRTAEFAVSELWRDQWKLEVAVKDAQLAKDGADALADRLERARANSRLDANGVMQLEQARGTARKAADRLREATVAFETFTATLVAAEQRRDAALARCVEP